MAKRSQGLQVYKQLAKQQAKAGRHTQPIYLDGEMYRVGDEVLEGFVSYARPAKPDEDDSEDKWRLVVRTREDDRTITIRPSQTRAVNRKEPNE